MAKAVAAAMHARQNAAARPPTSDPATKTGPVENKIMPIVVAVSPRLNADVSIRTSVTGSPLPHRLSGLIGFAHRAAWWAGRPRPPWTRYTPSGWPQTNYSNAQRGRQPTPEEVWLEAIVNAVIHRSYSVAGDHIRIDVLDDRIEVTSPGRFPGLSASKDPLAAMRFARNPRIARIFAELGWAQELGEGIRRMVASMRTAGLPAPVYQQTSETVTVVLTSTMIDPDVTRQLSPGWQDIVAALLQTGALRTGDVEELLDVTRPTAVRRPRQLEESGIA